MKNIINTYIKECKYDYCNIKIVDFSKFLTRDDYLLLQKFNVFIEDKLYTQEEFFLIKLQVFGYLALDTLSMHESNRLYDLFYSIINTYDF